jgi:hypothetical protein
MANTIQGKNIILYMLDSSVYYPVLCGQSMDFTLEQEPIEVTSINSTNAREYIAGMSTARCNINGITTLDNTGSRISILYAMQLSVRRVAQSWKIVMTDDEANIKNITFDGIITTTGFNRERASYSKSNLSILLSGDFTISDTVTPPVEPTIYEKYLTLTAGNYTLSHADLDAIVEVLVVHREGRQYDEVSGTPSGRQVKYTDGVGTGTLTFDSSLPAEVNESVHIVFKR